jgi:hypothetical protein
MAAGGAVALQAVFAEDAVAVVSEPAAQPAGADIAALAGGHCEQCVAEVFIGVAVVAVMGVGAGDDLGGGDLGLADGARPGGEDGAEGLPLGVVGDGGGDGFYRIAAAEPDQGRADDARPALE